MIHNSCIIQVVADAGPGGAPSHVRDLIFGLKANYPTWEIVLIAPPGWLADQVGETAQFRPLNFPNAYGKTIQHELADAIQNLWDDPQNPPLVHLHGVRAGIAGRLAIKNHWSGKRTSGHLLGGGPPVIYTEHLWTKDYHLASRLREFAQLRLLRSLDRVTTKTIAVSQAVADFLIAKKITAQNKVIVIPNGVAISPLAIRHSPATKLSYRIGSIGTLVPLKGYQTLIEAMPLILQNLPQTILEIVGDGPELHHLVELCRRLRLTEHVHLLGSGDKLNLAQKLTSWDVFVSTSHSESFGLAIAEAMAAGLPVVATNVGGVPELVTPETGLLVWPNDAHKLAKVLIDLLPQANRRLELGQAGQERISHNFNLDQMIGKTNNLYQEILVQS
ncbi:MAG: glycosyltransferase family 4 protein [Patescibacteria group bacterium]